MGQGNPKLTLEEIEDTLRKQRDATNSANIEHFVNAKIAEVMGISTDGSFTPKKIKGIPEKYGFETSCHICDTCNYGKWVDPENESYLLCNMGGIYWSLKVEKGTLVQVGTVHGLEIYPLVGNQNILRKIKREVFSLITNNNGSGKIIVPVEHRMK